MVETGGMWYTADRPVTKVMIPPVPSGYLHRFQLSMKYSRALACPVTTVVAPAGYGKTTSLCDAISRQNRTVAWLSLGKSDSQLFDFWSGVIYSIERAAPRLSKAPQELLMSGADIESVATTLINAVAESAPGLVLVLDNYHVISDESIHVSLTYLMRYLPPDTHLVILSRAELPMNLGFLRGHGQLCEIRTDDLRLSIDDTYSLFVDTMGYPLTRPMVRKLNDRFEGWVTGLRMAALTLSDSADVDRLLRFEERTEQGVMDYLASEVLELQDAPVSELLMKTSLFRRFSGEMCDYVFETTGSREMIDALLVRELFIQQDDEAGEWFRYHPIFRDALKKQMTKRRGGELPRIYLRASLWMEEQGLLEDALDYAIEADAFDRADKLLDKIVLIILGKDQYDKFWKWLRRLPANLVNSNLWANIGCAVSCEMTRASREQPQFVEKALVINREKGREILKTYPDGDNLLSSIRVLQILDAYHKGNMDSAIAFADEGLAALPKDKIQGRCSIMCLKGFSLFSIGDMDAAYQCCREAAFLGLMAKWKYSFCLNLSAAANIQHIMGRFSAAEESCREIIAMRSDDGREVSSSCYAHLLLSLIHYRRNQIPEAKERLEHALTLSDEGKEPVVWFICQMGLACFRVAEGKVKDSTDTALMARLSFETTIADSTISELLYSKLLMLSGDYAGALEHVTVFSSALKEDWADSANHQRLMRKYVFSSDVRNIGMEAPLLYFFDVMVANRRYDGIPLILSVIEKETERAGIGLALAHALILEAIVADALGDGQAAMDYLARALDVTEPAGVLRIYPDTGRSTRKLLRRARASGIHTDHVNKVLELFGDVEKVSTKSLTHSEGLTDAFTNREVQLLRMVCAGRSNQEIADKLYLSLSTVKNHIHNIYNKMGVSSRAKAIVRARKMGLLTEDDGE